MTALSVTSVSPTRTRPARSSVARFARARPASLRFSTPQPPPRILPPRRCGALSSAGADKGWICCPVSTGLLTYQQLPTAAGSPVTGVTGLRSFLMVADKTSRDPSKRYSTPVRWGMFFLGVWIMTIGIALTVHADLGTTPISTVPAAIAVASSLSFGVVTVLISIVLVIAQKVILRSRFVTFQYWQLLVALVFGALCDVSLYMMDSIQPSNYLWQWGTVILGAIMVS